MTKKNGKQKNKFVTWWSNLSCYTKNKSINALGFFFSFLILAGTNYCAICHQFLPTFFILDVFAIVLLISPIFFFKDTMFDRIYFPILLLLFTFLYTLNSCFYLYFGVVFCLKDFVWALQNAAQAGMHARAIKWWIIIINVAIFLVTATGMILFNALWRFKPNSNELKIGRRRKVAFSLLMLGASILSFEFSLQMWCIAERNKGVTDIDYVNYSPDYHFGNLGMLGFYTQEVRQMMFDKGASIESFREYMRGGQRPDNEFTGIFEGSQYENPNIIVIMLETGDQCILQEESIMPNLSKFLSEGLNCVNCYSYNHTNVSETIGINGNYPQYNLNDLGSIQTPFNLPHLLKENNYHSYFTHDVDKSNDSYDRITSMPKYGFDTCLFHNDVLPGVRPWVWQWANYTRDSIYIDGLIKKIKQFSTNNPFYMHYTTVHMHMNQEITKGNKEMFEGLENEFGQTLDNSEWKNPFSKNSEEANRYRRLMLKAMDFDKGLGSLMETLYSEASPDYLKNTMLVVYGDHSWYEETPNGNTMGKLIRNMTDINNIKMYPTILGFYHPLLNERAVSKYPDHQFKLPTWPTVIVPTILQLLGNEHYNPRMYLNKSIFDDDYDENELFYCFWTTRALNEKFASWDHHHVNYVYDDSINKKLMEQKLKDLRINLRMIDTIYKRNFFKKYNYDEFIPK